MYIFTCIINKHFGAQLSFPLKLNLTCYLHKQNECQCF